MTVGRRVICATQGHSWFVIYERRRGRDDTYTFCGRCGELGIEDYELEDLDSLFEWLNRP